jgi:hypothetical protein
LLEKRRPTYPCKAPKPVEGEKGGVGSRPVEGEERKADSRPVQSPQTGRRVIRDRVRVWRFGTS